MDGDTRLGDDTPAGRFESRAEGRGDGAFRFGGAGAFLDHQVDQGVKIVEDFSFKTSGAEIVENPIHALNDAGQSR